jgi:hypothetical protein
MVKSMQFQFVGVQELVIEPSLADNRPKQLLVVILSSSILQFHNYILQNKEIGIDVISDFRASANIISATLWNCRPSDVHL